MSDPLGTEAIHIDGIEVPPPPCATCRYYDWCKEEHQACGAFALYALRLDSYKGQPINQEPSDYWYRVVFPECDDSRVRRRV